jgi:hypothetical protein
MCGSGITLKEGEGPKEAQEEHSPEAGAQGEVEGQAGPVRRPGALLNTVS